MRPQGKQFVAKEGEPYRKRHDRYRHNPACFQINIHELCLWWEIGQLYVLSLSEQLRHARIIRIENRRRKTVRECSQCPRQHVVTEGLQWKNFREDDFVDL